jgi:hypothetical protein
MKKFYSLVVMAVLIVGFASASNAQAADNGLSGKSAAGPAFLGPIDTQVNGPWLEFLFGGAGSAAGTCGGICTPSSGGNSVELVSAPPWTFSLPFGGGTLTVSDAFQNGDVFDVYDNAALIGTTSAVAAAGSCGSDPAVCLPNPLSSSGAFALGAGGHGVGLIMAVSPFGGGAAYFRVDRAAIFADIDIKFCSNPNAYNTKKKGVTPVTIFGSASFDVNAIDRDTLQLCTDQAGTVCTPAGLEDSSTADRGDPTTDLGAAQCALLEVEEGIFEEQDYLNPDGFLDLDAAFNSQDLTALIGPVSKGDLVGPLYLVGYLNDATPITSVPVNSIGVDWLAIKK